jgi:hypothetical protein
MAKMYFDGQAGEHIAQRGRERIGTGPEGQRFVEQVKQILTMDAPADTAGGKDWWVQVGPFKLVCKGNMIKSALEPNMVAYGTEYRISGGRFVK